VLAESGLYLEELRRVTPDLESAFLAITQDPSLAGPAAGGQP
jgi:ABC-2 type transport system ATP-binding protein